MKTNRQIMTERKLLEKMDERRRLEDTFDWFLALLEDLAEIIHCLDITGLEGEEILWKVYGPLNRKAAEVYGRIGHLRDEIDRLYADMLIQEADVNASIPPVMHLMPPPLLEQTLFEIRSTAPYIMS